MDVEGLTADALIQAIRVFTKLAYAERHVPEHRKPIAEPSDDATLESLLSLSDVEARPPAGAGSPGYALRIGNDWYSHMKLTVAPYGLPPGYFFGVDTHDRFNVQVSEREEEALKRLQARNQELAKRIEQAWEEAGLPTQNGLLGSYLASDASNTSDPGPQLQ